MPAVTGRSVDGLSELSCCRNRQDTGAAYSEALTLSSRTCMLLSRTTIHVFSDLYIAIVNDTRKIHISFQGNAFMFY